MTERQSDSSLRELKDLPSPKSPAGLDARILERARAAAPEPATTPSLLDWNGPWLRGLATTGVLAVAILIAVPGLRDEQIISGEELRADHDVAGYEGQDDARSGQLARAHADKIAMDSSRPNAHLSKPAKRKTAHLEIQANYSHLGTTGYSLPSSERTASANRKRHENALNEAIVSSPTSESAAQEPEVMADSATAVAKIALPAAAKELNGIAAKAKPIATMTRDTLLLRLQKCEQLPLEQDMRKNDSEESDLLNTKKINYTAPSCYEALKKSCSTCELPETLQEAIKTLTSEPPEVTID